MHQELAYLPSKQFIRNSRSKVGIIFKGCITNKMHYLKPYLAASYFVFFLNFLGSHAYLELWLGSAALELSSMLLMLTFVLLGFGYCSGFQSEVHGPLNGLKRKSGGSRLTVIIMSAK